MRQAREACWSLFLISLVFLVGCTSGSGLVGISGPSQQTGGNPPPLPSTDAGLAEHAPRQIIVRFLSGADMGKVIGAVSGVVLKEITDLDAVVAILPEGVSIVESIRKIQKMSGVKYAEPNYIYRALVVPNDPFFASKQWGPQKIRGPAAWDITTGNANGVVAILDTGVSSTHPEFSGKILPNQINCLVPGGGIEDNNGHGTHVAGIAAAIGNNAAGVAGMAWAASMLVAKVLDSSGVGTTDQIGCGIRFVRDYALFRNPGARVVMNLSLGGAGYSQLMKDDLDGVIGEANVVVVAAAGNDGKATVLFPAGYPGVMAVGATTPTDERATFSSYGSHLSVVAPGLDVYSTVPGGSFGFESGTSVSAPHVAGVVALIRGRDPSLTVTRVRSQIEQTATDLGAPGFDPQFGWGLVNAEAAVGPAVAGNYGRVEVTVLEGVSRVPGIDVILWTATSFCLGLTEVKQTAKSGSTGIAIFNTVPVGSYCASASQVGQPGRKGVTPAPFEVAVGGTTRTSVTIAF